MLPPPPDGHHWEIVMQAFDPNDGSPLPVGQFAAVLVEDEGFIPDTPEF